MKKLSFLTVQSIIQWASNQDVLFLGGSRSLPYVLKDKAYHYFKLTEREYELVMVSDRDLEAYR
jgi:hypothetical protein